MAADVGMIGLLRGVAQGGLSCRLYCLEQDRHIDCSRCGVPGWLSSKFSPCSIQCASPQFNTIQKHSECQPKPP
jgi:hypothetical protein